jgi:hypothetical protein
MGGSLFPFIRFPEREFLRFLRIMTELAATSDLALFLIWLQLFYRACFDFFFCFLAFGALVEIGWRYGKAEFPPITKGYVPPSVEFIAKYDIKPQ